MSPQAPLGCDCFSDFFRFLWLVWRGLIHYLGFVWCFAHGHPGMIGLREEVHRGEMPFSSHLIESAWYQPDASLLTWVGIVWLRQCLPEFLTVESLFLPSFSSGRGHYVTQWAQLPSRRLCSTSLSVGCFHKWFGIPPCRRSVFLPIYLFNHLFISVWTRECLFYTLGYNPMLFYLFCCSDCSSVGHLELFWLAPVSLWHIPTIVVIFFFF